MSPALPAPTLDARVLVADIGGTHARFAWADGQGRIATHTRTAVAAHDSLPAALQACVPQHGQAVAACFAVAGQVDAGGSALSANLGWALSAPLLQAQLGYPVRVINDFHALALGCRQLDAAAGLLIHGPQRVAGPRQLVIGPGTGLGCALLLEGDGPQVLPSEAGQIALAASSAVQAAVLEQLRSQRDDGHVSVEYAVSGPGLHHTYRALCALHGRQPLLERPEQVSAAALAGSDADAQQALALFCQWLGGFAADMAMATGADAVWLAGGIVPQMADQLAPHGFNQAFSQRGVLGSWLAQRPVRVIEHGQLGLVGAALASTGAPAGTSAPAGCPAG